MEKTEEEKLKELYDKFDKHYTEFIKNLTDEEIKELKIKEKELSYKALTGYWPVHKVPKEEK